MPKPEPVRPIVEAKPVIRTHLPAKRVVAQRMGNNEYRIIEEEYDCPPTSVRVLQPKTERVPAEDEVRIWNETHLGVDRFGSSGL